VKYDGKIRSPRDSSSSEMPGVLLIIIIIIIIIIIQDPSPLRWRKMSREKRHGHGGAFHLKRHPRCLIKRRPHPVMADVAPDSIVLQRNSPADSIKVCYRHLKRKETSRATVNR
jgi:hypothetical protein